MCKIGVFLVEGSLFGWKTKGKPPVFFAPPISKHPISGPISRAPRRQITRYAAASISISLLDSHCPIPRSPEQSGCVPVAWQCQQLVRGKTLRTDGAFFPVNARAQSHQRSSHLFIAQPFARTERCFLSVGLGWLYAPAPCTHTFGPWLCQAAGKDRSEA